MKRGRGIYGMSTRRTLTYDEVDYKPDESTVHALRRGSSAETQHEQYVGHTITNAGHQQLGPAYSTIESR